MTETPENVLLDPANYVDDLQRKWLKPLSPIGSVLHRVLFAANWALLRTAFRLNVEGLSSVPESSQVIVAPNHESSLDAPLLAAALPYHVLRRTCWAARKGRVLSNRMTRAFSRVAQVIPIDRDVSALAAGAEVLQRGYNLAWFPEGTRTRDGALQEFKYGVGALARHAGISIVPVRIDGAFEALPPDRSMPRLFSEVAVRFGDPVTAGDYCGTSDLDYARSKRVADKVRDRVEELEESV